MYKQWLLKGSVNLKGFQKDWRNDKYLSKASKVLFKQTFAIIGQKCSVIYGWIIDIETLKYNKEEQKNH